MKKRWVNFVAPVHVDGLPRLLYAGTDVATDATYDLRGERRSRSPRVVFQFTLGGEGYLSWGDETRTVSRGEAFCYNLGDPGYSYYYPPNGTEAWSFVYCVFVGMTDTVLRLVELHGPVFHLGDANPAVWKLQALLESLDAPAPSLDASRHFDLCALIVSELVRCAEGGGSGPKGKALIHRARERIQADLSVPFHLDTLAEKLGVTPEHLCRAFRAQCGITPKGYHDELRLGRVCDHLLNSQANIKQIALDAGFADLSHFTKFFKARRGVTPGEFRRHGAYRY